MRTRTAAARGAPGASPHAADADGRALLVNFPRRIVLHHFNFKVRVHALAFSPDGRFFAASHGAKVQLWRTPGLRREFSPFVLFRTFTGFGDDVTSLSWSGDSRFLLAGSRDMTCKVFAIDPQPGFIPHTLAGHRDAIVAAFFADDARTVYSVARDGAIYAWAWRAHGKARAKHWRRKWRRLGESGAGKIQRTLAHREAGAAAAESSEDEEASDGDGGGEEGAQDEGQGSAEPWAMAVTQGRWHLARKHLVVEQRATIQTATFHPGSSLLVLGLSTGVFALHAMPECEAVHTLSVSQRAITAAAIGPGGDWLALGSAALGQLLVWEWATETCACCVRCDARRIPLTHARSPFRRAQATGALLRHEHAGLLARRAARGDRRGRREGQGVVHLLRLLLCHLRRPQRAHHRRGVHWLRPRPHHLLP